MHVCNRTSDILHIGKHALHVGESVVLTDDEVASLHPLTRATLAAMSVQREAEPEAPVATPVAPPGEPVAGEQGSAEEPAATPGEPVTEGEPVAEETAGEPEATEEDEELSEDEELAKMLAEEAAAEQAAKAKAEEK